MKNSQPSNNREIIQSITGITDLEYSTKVFDSAHQYLEIGFRFTADQRKKLVNCQLFWMWWMRQWNLREEALVGKYMLAQAMGEHLNMHAEFLDAHAPIRYMKIAPNRWALTSILSVIKTYETKAPAPQGIAQGA